MKTVRENVYADMGLGAPKFSREVFAGCFRGAFLGPKTCRALSQLSNAMG